MAFGGAMQEILRNKEKKQEWPLVLGYGILTTPGLVKIFRENAPKDITAQLKEYRPGAQRIILISAAVWGHVLYNLYGRFMGHMYVKASDNRHFY